MKSSLEEFLTEPAPQHIDWMCVYKDISQGEYNVTGVYDLHIWSIFAWYSWSIGYIALYCRRQPPADVSPIIVIILPEHYTEDGDENDNDKQSSSLSSCNNASP
jgi:hypothetical protein